MSYMSSALARVIDSVLPGGGGRTRVPSKRGAGRTFSVTGNAQSGLSAAAATPDINASARTPMTFRMTPPNCQLVQGLPESDPTGRRSAHAFTAYPIVKRVASDHFAASA